MRAPPDVAGYFERKGQRLPFSVRLDMSEVQPGRLSDDPR